MKANLLPPRAITRRSGLINVRAEAAPPSPANIAALGAAFEEFKARHISRVDALEAAVDQSALRDGARKLNGDFDGQPVDGEYRKTFASYARRGAIDAETTLKGLNETGERASIQAAFTEGDNSSGGYFAPVEWDRQIRKAQRSESPFRRLSLIVTTGVNGYSTLWNNNLWGSGWVGETANRPQTTGPAFTPIVFPAGEIYAMPAATQRLLDDAVIDFEAWISNELGEEFSRQEALAFVSGDGVNKPMGFLQYLPGGAAAAAVLDGSGNVVTPGTAAAHPGGNLIATPSGAAGDIKADALIDLIYGLPAAYRQNAVWLMSSTTAAAVRKMKDASGAFLWRDGLALEQPPTLLGKPVEIDENMPSVAAGNYPIAFGDFSRGYLVNDRIGVRVLRDPFTAKPYVLFYATKRVGGGVLDPRAIRVLKIAAN